MTAHTSAGTLTHDEDIWLGTGQFAHLAGISPRVARRIMTKAADGAPWRGARLVVRNVRIAGGASSKHREVLLTSLPPELQAKHHRQQPMSELQEKIAEHAAAIEEKRGNERRRKGGRAQLEPWTPEERETRHAAFAQLPTSIQEEATRRQKAVWFLRSLSGLGLPLRDRYDLAAKEAGVSVPTIRRWVKKCRGLDPGDRLVALAPAYGRRECEPKISPTALEFIKSEYFQLTKPALKAIWRRARIIARSRDWAIPSYSSVKRLINMEPHWRHALLREGAEAFERLYPAQQRDYSALRIHQLWCGDGRKGDLFVRWEDGVVSRPIVVAWIDVRTRVFLGYAVGKVESADLIRLAFKDAAEKSRALPEEVLIDNGRGFASKLLTGSVPNRFRFKVNQEDPLGIFPLLGVVVVWAQPYAGRSKNIESFWRQIAEAEKRFPGAFCGNNPDARPEDCNPKNAVSVAAYRQVIEETLAIYHQTPHLGDAMDGRSPRAVYEELIAQTPVRSPSKEQLRLCMLAAEQIKLDPRDRSVRILKNRYWAERLADLSPKKVFTVRFNPEAASDPIALYEGGRFICEATLVGRTGFRSQQAAKDHLRAKRQFERARKDQERARKESHKAASWVSQPGSAEDRDPIADQIAKAMLPAPRIPRLVTPEQDFRAAEVPVISPDEAQAAITRYYNSRK